MGRLYLELLFCVNCCCCVHYANPRLSCTGEMVLHVVLPPSACFSVNAAHVHAAPVSKYLSPPIAHTHCPVSCSPRSTAFHAQSADEEVARLQVLLQDLEWAELSAGHQQPTAQRAKGPFQRLHPGGQTPSRPTSAGKLQQHKPRVRPNSAPVVAQGRYSALDNFGPDFTFQPQARADSYKYDLNSSQMPVQSPD